MLSRDKTVQCRYCQSRIDETALKCPKCQEWLVAPEEAQRIIQQRQATEARKRKEQRQMNWAIGILAVAFVGVSFLNQQSLPPTEVQNARAAPPVPQSAMTATVLRKAGCAPSATRTNVKGNGPNAERTFSCLNVETQVAVLEAPLGTFRSVSLTNMLTEKQFTRATGNLHNGKNLYAAAQIASAYSVAEEVSSVFSREKAPKIAKAYLKLETLSLEDKEYRVRVQPRISTWDLSSYGAMTIEAASPQLRGSGAHRSP